LMPLSRSGYGLYIQRCRIESLSVVSRFQDETSTSSFLTGMVDFASDMLISEGTHDSKFVEELEHA
jgi:hypothetical protein